jgi:hypothetical protein
VERRFRVGPNRRARLVRSYLTTYDTGLNGGYGEFTGNEEDGAFNHIYASGFNDSGFYIGACRECAARVNDATMETTRWATRGRTRAANF